MNTENMKELLNQAKEAATTDEAKSLVNDLEVLIDLYNQKDSAGKTEEFAQNVQKAHEKFLVSLGKAAFSLGMGTDISEGLVPKAEDYSSEQLEKIQAMKQKLEESVSPLSAMKKLRNHTKVRS